MSTEINYQAGLSLNEILKKPISSVVQIALPNKGLIIDLIIIHDDQIERQHCIGAMYIDFKGI